MSETPMDTWTERIPDLDRVVEESEGSLTSHGGEPERQLGHFSGDRVLVDSVETMVDDLSAGEDARFVCRCCGKVNESLGEHAFARTVLGH